MDQLGIAIVGTGDMGGAYAQAIVDHVPEARLACVAGGRRGAELGMALGVPWEPDLAAALARSDVAAVVLAVPHSLHAPMTLAALEAGRDVLVEKPLARTVAEADSMLAAAARLGRRLDVILTMRFDRHVLEAHRLVEAGAIGEVRMLRVSGHTPGYDMGHKTWIAHPDEGGALLDWGAHAFDLLAWFAGAPPLRLAAEVTGFGVAPVGDATAMVQLAYPTGAMGQLWLSYEMPEPGLDSPFRLWIVGSRGILEVSRFGPLRLGDPRGWQTILEATPADWALERRLDAVRVAAPAAQLRAWAQAIRAGEAGPAPAAHGREAVLQVEQALVSARTHATIDLEARRR